MSDGHHIEFDMRARRLGAKCAGTMQQPTKRTHTSVLKSLNPAEHEAITETNMPGVNV
jgi:hypothetical protein